MRLLLPVEYCRVSSEFGLLNNTYLLNYIFYRFYLFESFNSFNCFLEVPYSLIHMRQVCELLR